MRSDSAEEEDEEYEEEVEDEDEDVVYQSIRSRLERLVKQQETKIDAEMVAWLDHYENQRPNYLAMLQDARGKEREKVEARIRGHSVILERICGVPIKEKYVDKNGLLYPEYLIKFLEQTVVPPPKCDEPIKFKANIIRLMNG